MPQKILVSDKENKYNGDICKVNNEGSNNFLIFYLDIISLCDVPNICHVR